MHRAALNTPSQDVLADSAETSLPWLKSRLLHSKDKTAARPRPARPQGGGGEGPQSIDTKCPARCCLAQLVCKYSASEMFAGSLAGLALIPWPP